MYTDPNKDDPFDTIREVTTSNRSQVDAVIMFSPRIEAGRVASRQGIFTHRQAPPHAVAAAAQEGGWRSVAQAWYPGYTPGYGGFHQTWISRQPVSGNISIGVARDCHAHPRSANGKEIWYFSALIRVEGGAVLYNRSAGVTLPPANRTSTSPVTCPGMQVAQAAALGVRCTARRSDNATAVFKEIVQVFTE